MRKSLRGTLFIYLSITIMISFMFTFVINITRILKDYKDYYEQETNNFLYIAADVNTYIVDGDSGEIEGNQSVKNNECYNNFFEKDYKELFNNLKGVNDIIIKTRGLDVGLPIMNIIYNIGLYYNGEIPCKYTMLEGHFFTHKEMESNEKFVVIGKNNISKCIEENGEKYLLKGEEKVKVIGVIGEENYDSIYDNYVFYNLNAFANEIRGIGLGEWKVDSTKYSREELKKIIKDNGRDDCLYGGDSDTSTNGAAINDTFSRNKDTVISSLLIAITLLIALVQAIIYWIGKLRLEIGVRKSYGATNRQILFIVIKGFYLVELLSTITAILVIGILSKIKIFRVFYTGINKEIIIGIMGLLIVIGFIPLVSTILVLRKNTIVDMLKEGAR